MARNGYVWWYVDGLSADGQYGITLIAFIGSVFSPYYAFARRFGRGDPENHCALNVALYGRGNRRWAMTERGRRHLARDATNLKIGPSRVLWDGDGLTFEIDEATLPLASRIRGTVRLRPAALETQVYPLVDGGRHRWRPVAPCAAIDVTLERPSLCWSGSGYFDTNAGDEPLEDGFSRWTWCRGQLPRRGTAILYDAVARTGAASSMALRFDPSGGVEIFDPPPPVALAGTPWRMARDTRCDAGCTAKVQKTLEDSPFYTRSIIASQLFGERVCAMHESLSLDRFRAPWMQMMLPFRMPRALR